MHLWFELAVLTAAGIFGGSLNVLAGGGSFVTLPLLLFFGLPGPLANGTNRLGILTQNFGGIWGFHRHGALDWRWAGAATVPALAGAAIGVWLALSIPDLAFRRILSIAMVVVTLWSISGRRSAASGATQVPASRWWVLVSFFFIGIYGGFIQAGVGFFILAVTTAAGMDLMRGNAVKAFVVFALTALSLAVFVGAGSVDWPRGLALATGNLIGGFIGVRIAIGIGHVWLERFVSGMVVVFAVLLWVL